MSAINDLFDKRDSGPYSKPLRVVVVASDEASKYRGQDGSERKCMSTAISDGTTCILCKVYAENKFSKFTSGTSLVMRDVIHKTDDSRHIVVTEKTKVFVTANMVIPDSHLTQGQAIIHPPSADVVPLQAALTSPPKKRVSVCGRLVQEEAKRTVKVRGEDVEIKVVTLEENSTKAKVTLWRETACADINTGDYISVTDVVVNVFKGDASLSSTNRSKVMAAEAPLEDFVATIDGVNIDGQTADLLTSTGDVISINAEMLQTATENDIEAFFISHVPVAMKFVKRGAIVEGCSLVVN